MHISDWSSDVCSSDLGVADAGHLPRRHRAVDALLSRLSLSRAVPPPAARRGCGLDPRRPRLQFGPALSRCRTDRNRLRADGYLSAFDQFLRSEEHTSELQSLMRISYAVFCLKKKKNNILNK